MVNINNSLKIEGFMAFDELVWLATEAQNKKSIAEIGSYKGCSARAMIDHMLTGQFVSVDAPLEDQPLYAPEYWKELEKNLRVRDDVTVHLLHMASVNAAKQISASCRQEPCFDMIFIDGSHDYDNVAADIKAWWPMLKEGGTICGHDFQKCFPGVEKAVSELIPVFFQGPGSIWYLRTGNAEVKLEPNMSLGPCVWRNGKKVQLDLKGNPVNG